MPAVLGFVRSVQGAIILGLCAALTACLLVIYGLHIGPIGFDGLTEKLEDCRAEKKELRADLDEAARQSERQKAETSRAMGEVRNDEKAARSVSDRIRNAAPTKNCDTPDAILQAEI